jgi:hypothetical protein
MGNCWNCGKQITLKDDEVRCDACGEVINYQCLVCHGWFSIWDEKTGEKIKQCGICGFFPCVYCGVCSPSCEKNLWQSQIKKILSPEIRLDNTPNLQEKINRLSEYIEEIKIGHEQRVCPNKVSISYTKGRIKGCYVRTEGYRCKNLLDIQKFRERIDKVADVEEGTILTINKTREEGTYGQEYRDVFNACICLGKLKKEKTEKIIEGEKTTIEVWKRVQNEQCPYLDLKNLILKFCPECKRNYTPNYNQCSVCVIKKGNNKGQPRQLKLKISNKDICQLNRGFFKRDDGSTTIQGNN